LRLLCGGAQLYAVTDGDDVVELDDRRGRRRVLAHEPNVWSLFSDGAALFVARKDEVVQLLPTRRRYPLAGRPAAAAATAHKLYVATREGPLWEIDRQSAAARDLGLGGWWGTLALAATAGRLYAVTQSGKLWEIDPGARTKTVWQMSGWEGALALAVRR
jgi:hypothetical protein